MIVATVYASKRGTLETGVCDPKDYGPEHVRALREQFRRHLKVEHRFVCLTDVPGARGLGDTFAFNLLHDWGGWWAKIELFRYLKFGEPILYCDLDNVILGDVERLTQCMSLRDPSFIMARDWDYEVPNSSLMYWASDYSWIYDTFARNPETNAENYMTMPLLGDQAFIASVLATRGITPKFWQHLLPGFFRSRHDVAASRLDGGSMVLWHGRPKPWQFGTFPEDSGISKLQRAGGYAGSGGS